jgi:hypothetical protein
LERRVVVLGPTNATTRPITCPDTGLRLGFARREPRPGGPWWRRLAPPGLAVHEQDDEPLVFTVRRAWGLGPRLHVRDADGHPVGCVRGARVENVWGRTLAVLRPGEAAGERVFRTPDGRELARLLPGPAGLRVSFAAGVEDPFLKMLLLAAALWE